MSLATPSKIRELQIKLYRKAKNEASPGALPRHQPLQYPSGVRRVGRVSLRKFGLSLRRHTDSDGIR